MCKTHRRPSSKLEVKIGWNITWKQLRLLFQKENQIYCKVKFLIMCRYSCNEDFIPQDLD